MKEDEQTRLKVRRVLRQREKYLIYPILPNGSFHVTTGPSGIGKTTWWFQTLHDWERGDDILGFKSNPVPWVYISLDRGLSETDRTLRRIGLEDWDIPAYDMSELIPKNTEGRIDLEPHLDQIIRAFPDAEMYFIEGLQGLVPTLKRGESQNKAELLFCMRMRHELLDHGKTIIAVTHSPKGVIASNNRESMLGSQALIGAASTIIHFGTPDGTDGKKLSPDQTDSRLVTVMGRDFADIRLTYDRKPNGCFELKEKATTKPDSTGEHTEPDTEVFETYADKLMVMRMKLNSVPIQTILKKKEFYEWGFALGLSAPLVDQWLKTLVATGVLLKEGPQNYRRSSAVQ
jgi:hypothetical protein